MFNVLMVSLTFVCVRMRWWQETRQKVNQKRFWPLLSGERSGGMTDPSEGTSQMLTVLFTFWDVKTLLKTPKFFTKTVIVCCTAFFFNTNIDRFAAQDALSGSGLCGSKHSVNWLHVMTWQPNVFGKSCCSILGLWHLRLKETWMWLQYLWKTKKLQLVDRNAPVTKSLKKRASHKKPPLNNHIPLGLV